MAPPPSSYLSRDEAHAGLEVVEGPAQPFASARRQHSETALTVPKYPLCPEKETVDFSHGQEPRHHEEDLTKYDASTLVSSEWSDADTVLGSPTTYSDRRDTCDMGRRRSSIRSYQELWPSSPTSLVHTMPATPVPSRDALPLPSYPLEGRLATAQISAPILKSSSTDIPNYILVPSSNTGATSRTHSWPGPESYCPHRHVPSPPREHRGDNNGNGDGEKEIDSNGERKRAQLRSKMSHGLQRLLRKSG